MDNVVKTFLAMADAEVNDLTDPTLERGRKFLDTAANFIVEWQLRSWISLQNLGKGVAPAIDLVLAQRDMIARQVRTLSEPVAERQLTRSGSYKWVHRWRGRWRMPKGRFGMRDFTPLTEMRQKACRRLILGRPHHNLDAAKPGLKRASKQGPLWLYEFTKVAARKRPHF